MELIDKDALVAELKKRIGDYWSDSENTTGIYPYALEEVINYIDTLKVKDVDFETAFAASIDHFDERNNYGRWTETDLRQFAKHFFELGLKTQKGE